MGKIKVHLFSEFGPPSVICKDLLEYKTIHDLASDYHIANSSTYLYS